jgi:hypothetical protein
MALALAAVGCYDPLLEDGHFMCANNNQCPPGFYCAQACNLCYHDTDAGKQLALTCTIVDVNHGGGGTAGGSGEGAGGFHTDGSGGGGEHTGAGGGSVVGGGGSSGTAGVSGSAGAMVGSGGHGGTIVGGSGGTPGGAGGMTGAAGAMGTAGHAGTGGTSGVGGLTGSGGAMMGAGGAMGVGGKTGVGGTMMGTGGAMMGVGGAMMGMGGAAGLGLGSPCSVGTQCATGLCVDKVCCNAACSGQCMACDIASNQGTCLPVASGPPHGTRAACGGSGTCGAQCKLITASTADCVFAPSTVTCAPQTCTGSTLTPPRVCDGIGSCAPGAASACPLGLSCDTAQTACLASCTTNADCTAAVPNCNPSTHQCTTAGPIGASCSVATDCQNGMCVDGFCCDSACNGACQACDVVAGHCTALNSGQPHGQRGACGTPGDPCGGQCNGANAMQCTFPSGNACSCPGVSLAGMCNGAGGCQTLLNLCLL